MMLLAAAIAAAQPAAFAPTSAAVHTGASVTAIATVRIIHGVRLKLDSDTNAEAPRAHDGKIRTNDGAVLPARLIEFE